LTHYTPFSTLHRQWHLSLDYTERKRRRKEDGRPGIHLVRNLRQRKRCRPLCSQGRCSLCSDTLPQRCCSYLIEHHPDRPGRCLVFTIWISLIEVLTTFSSDGQGQQGRFLEALRRRCHSYRSRLPIP
jgi:hypothetical protein